MEAIRGENNLYLFAAAPCTLLVQVHDELALIDLIHLPFGEEKIRFFFSTED